MDPIANLKEQLELALWIVDQPDSEEKEFYLESKATRLAELVLALDEWQRKGGFSPYSSSLPVEG